ncbi:MAG: ABC transporter permease [Acidobacteriota bacterium]|nr:ABC transporter permease [Acidobacteriota bacterium]
MSSANAPAHSPARFSPRRPTPDQLMRAPNRPAKRANDIACVFRIQLAGLRAEFGPFLLAALVFPAATYLFANAVGGAEAAAGDSRLRFLAGSIVFSVSLTSISWLGYLLLENRFTGRLKLFATLPLAPSSYVFGVLLFALAQTAAGTLSLFAVSRLIGVRTRLDPAGAALVALIVVLTMLCLCGLGVVIAARARSFSEGSLLTDTLGAGLVFLAPVYYPAEAMPRALRVVAELLPTAFAARAVRTALAGGHAVGVELIALALFACATLSLGFRLMNWRER